jgi:hypothetical protein
MKTGTPCENLVDARTFCANLVHQFSTGWVVGVVSMEKKESVAGHQFAVTGIIYWVKNSLYCWTQKLNKEDYGVDKYLSSYFLLFK